MASRRQFGKTVVAAAAMLGGMAGARRAPAAERAAPQLGDDGLYIEPWFMQTFLVLPDDLKEAAAEGKRFAVIWEQKGCPYCREMHTVNFARPAISEYVREHFGIVQLNIWGAREVTDFDGQVLGEQRLAAKSRVYYTPTIQFFRPAIDKARTKPAADLEVARMPGYFKPFHFITMFEFVYQKAYERTTFQRYLQDKFAALTAKGIKPE